MSAVQIEHPLAAAVGAARRPAPRRPRADTARTPAPGNRGRAPPPAGRCPRSLPRFAASPSPCLQVQPGRRRGEARRLRQTEHAVHPLHGAAGRALVEIVDGAHHRHRAAARHRREVRVVARRDVLDARRLRSSRARTARRHRTRAAPPAAPRCRAGASAAPARVTWMPRANGPGVRHERELAPRRPSRRARRRRSPARGGAPARCSCRDRRGAADGACRRRACGRSRCCR